MRKRFDRLVARLERTTLNLKVKMEINEIIVEYGSGVSREVRDRVLEIADELSMEITVCAEQTGGKILDSVLINGGPKRN
jgi:hypothetical protein